MNSKKRKIPISLKLVGTVGAILLIFSIFCIICIVEIKKVDDSYNNLLDRREKVIENVQELQYMMTNMEVAVQQGLLLNDDSLKKSYDELKQHFENTLDCQSCHESRSAKNHT